MACASDEVGAAHEGRCQRLQRVSRAAALASCTPSHASEELAAAQWTTCCAVWRKTAKWEVGCAEGYYLTGVVQKFPGGARSGLWRFGVLSSASAASGKVAHITSCMAGPTALVSTMRGISLPTTRHQHFRHRARNSPRPHTWRTLAKSKVQAKAGAGASKSGRSLSTENLEQDVFSVLDFSLKSFRGNNIQNVVMDYQGSLQLLARSVLDVEATFSCVLSAVTVAACHAQNLATGSPGLNANPSAPCHRPLIVFQLPSGLRDEFSRSDMGMTAVAAGGSLFLASPFTNHSVLPTRLFRRRRRRLSIIRRRAHTRKFLATAEAKQNCAPPSLLGWKRLFSRLFFYGPWCVWCPL